MMILKTTLWLQLETTYQVAKAILNRLSTRWRKLIYLLCIPNIFQQSTLILVWKQNSNSEFCSSALETWILGILSTANLLKHLFQQTEGGRETTALPDTRSKWDSEYAVAVILTTFIQNKGAWKRMLEVWLTTEEWESFWILLISERAWWFLAIWQYQSPRVHEHISTC